jgi:hypothetical protein
MADEEEDVDEEEEEEEYPPWLKVVVDDEAAYWDEVTVLEPGGELPADTSWSLGVLCAVWCVMPDGTAPFVLHAGDAGPTLKEWVEVKVRQHCQSNASSSAVLQQQQGGQTPPFALMRCCVPALPVLPSCSQSWCQTPRRQQQARALACAGRTRCSATAPSSSHVRHQSRMGAGADAPVGHVWAEAAVAGLARGAAPGRFFTMPDSREGVWFTLLTVCCAALSCAVLPLQPSPPHLPTSVW